jgi:hypothetical protein
MCVDRILAGPSFVLKILVVFVGPSRRMPGKNFEISRINFQIFETTRRDTILASKASFNKTQLHKFIEYKPWDVLGVST